MDDECALRELCEILRETAWERARGELMSMLRGRHSAVQIHLGRHDKMVILIDDFIVQMDDLMK